MAHRRGNRTVDTRRTVQRSDGLFPDPLLTDIFSRKLLPSLFDAPVKALEDRRTFHPLGSFRPPAALPRAAARIVAKATPSRPNVLSERLGFSVPDRVAVCVRRKQRREVIHAFKKNGSGGSKRRRRNPLSNIDC